MDELYLDADGQIKLESRPVRFGRAAGTTEFGHIGVEAPDVAEMRRFWTRHFTMKVSDWIGQTACLMRFDPVHHKFAVFHEDTGLAHINFQVASIDDIMRSWHFLQDNGFEIEMGPGRPPVDRDLPVLQGPGGHHLGVLLRCSSHPRRHGLAAPVLRPLRARLHRHVARQDHDRASSSVGWIEAEDATARAQPARPPHCSIPLAHQARFYSAPPPSIMAPAG